MAVKWNCDICGKETHVSPPIKPVTRKDKKTGQEVQVMTKMRSQDQFTGEVRTVEVAKVKDMFPRTHIVRLTAGQEAVQRDFCEKCLDKVMPELKALWDKLEKIKGK